MITRDIIPVLLGPTASGKTSIGIELARLLKGEVISVDSRKVYRGLPVGTATPEGEWKDGAYWVKGVAHHLMAHLPPDRPYTAGDFVTDAERLIGEIRARGRVPILVGGTGFYVKSLALGLPQLPSRNAAFRADLEKRVANEGSAALHRELIKKDPAAGKSISANDRHKIIRALEIIWATGKPYSAWKNAKPAKPRHRFAMMALDFPKELLERRIHERSARMEKEGMIEETAELLKQGFSPGCAALASFGYREAVQVVRGDIPRAEFLSLLIKGTLAYAKRQRTWLRTQTKPIWFPCDENTTKEEIAMKMKAFLDGKFA